MQRSRDIGRQREDAALVPPGPNGASAARIDFGKAVGSVATRGTILTAVAAGVVSGASRKALGSAATCGKE